ncbi:hypothetical protein AALP_AA5G204300 [Arabis alpina]|uniref:Uncharacterized protein n=1 Tax=Arabis alpina TaxID=50452 RepID=A0A087GYC0_ARAAL|nr:hypothetical protein AALP_AA5G204300 [Arabis alpina]
MDSSPLSANPSPEISQQTIDFDLLMPSSERRLDFAPPAPVHGSVAHGTEVSSSSPATAPDPRWPLLNRWSVQSSPVPPSITLVEDPTPADGSPTVVTTSLQRGETSLALVNGSLPLSDTQRLEAIAINTTDINTPVINEQYIPLPFSKGAWEKPLAIPKVAGQQPCTTHALGIGSGGSKTEEAALKAHSKDYPWAAKMNPALRNLHRVTIPDYMEDGTPKVHVTLAMSALLMWFCRIRHLLPNKFLLLLLKQSKYLQVFIH